MKTFSRLPNHSRSAARIVAALALLQIASLPLARAQGSRKDDIVFGPAGHPVAGATITVCQATATGTPCSPLATVYTDATLTVPSANPFQSDGIGNYHFYAPAGRYMIQITAPTITGTISQHDVILPPDVSSSASGNNISAFGLNLGGSLSVAGNANISGTLTTSGFSPGSFTPSSLSVTGSETIQGPRPRLDVTAYGAKDDGATDDTAAIQSAINAACVGFSGISTAGPDIFFPPGVYWLTQHQGGGSDNTPIFNFPSGCAPTMIGTGGTAGGSAFPTMAAGSELLVHNLGSAPNAGPIFLYSSANGVPDGRIENLTIAGYNRAVEVINAEPFVMVNVCTVAFVTGFADNAPIKITDTFWFYWKGGCSSNGNIALSGGWGSGAAVSASSGFAQRMRFTVTAGTSPTANPTVTVTFPSAFPSAPLCIGHQTGGSGAIQALTSSSAETTTTAGLQWNGTPANGSTYIVTVDCR